MPRIDSISTVAKDMGSTLDFYRQLGMEIPADADREGYVVVSVGGGLRFSWNTEDVERSFNNGSQAPPTSGRMGTSFRCEDATEVDLVYAKLVAAGHKGVLPPFDAPWGARHCRVLDPDGNVVDLFAPMP